MSSDDQPDIDEKKWRHLDETVVESFFDRARQNLHCRIACGGLTCKHEDHAKQQFHELIKNLAPTDKSQPPQKPAVLGLNSNWVGELIVASQRPSTCLFSKFNHIEQFAANKITGVFNLQEKGEHAFCGPNGIFSDSGYSYNGERDLMRYGVSYYEFPWPDMTAPENDIVFRSVQCMDSHIKKLGRVLVHCHAGLGRTGLMIACYYIMCQHLPAKAAIDLVRRCRNGAIQTSRQVAFVEGFEKFSRALGFTMKRSPHDPFLDFASYMKRQYEFLHGDDSRTYRFVPYHIHQILCRVIDLASTGGRNAANEALMAFSLSNQPSAAVVDSCRGEINQRKYDPEKTSNISLLIFLVLDWFRAMDTPFFTRDHANIFLNGMRNPRNFIQNIAALQESRRQAKKERILQRRKEMLQQKQNNTTLPYSPKETTTTTTISITEESTSLNNTNFHTYLAQQQQKSTLSTTTNSRNNNNNNNTMNNAFGAVAGGGAIPTWQILSPTTTSVQPPTFKNSTITNNKSNIAPSSSDDDGDSSGNQNNNNNFVVNNNLDSNSVVLPPSAIPQQQPQTSVTIPAASPFFQGISTNHHTPRKPGPSHQRTLSNTLASITGAVGSPSPTTLNNENIIVSQYSSFTNNTFHKKPRIPWILQKEVEDQIPREVRHTAALVLSAIATLVAEAAPIPSLLDVAIQSTVDAFTLNLPPDTYHTFYYFRSSDQDEEEGTSANENNNNHNSNNNNNNNSTRKKKMYRLSPDDRRILYEAFTRWCAHEHATYFDVFSNNHNNSQSIQFLVNSTKKEQEQQRIMAGLKSAAESRLPNFQSKMQQGKNNGNNSRSVSPSAINSNNNNNNRQQQKQSESEPAVENIE